MIAWDTTPLSVILSTEAAITVAQNETQLWKQAAIRNRAKYERTVYVALCSWLAIGALLYLLVCRN